MLVENRLRLRREQAVPRLAEFRAWLESQQAECGGPVLPRSPMGQAIRYALNQWDTLVRFLDDGRIREISNNGCERALRATVIGRRN